MATKKAETQTYTFGGSPITKDQYDKIKQSAMMGQYGIAQPSQAFSSIYDTLYNQPEESNKAYELAGMYTQLAQTAAAMNNTSLAEQYLGKVDEILSGAGAQIPGVSGMATSANAEVPVSVSDLGQFKSFADVKNLGESVGGISVDEINRMYEIEKAKEAEARGPQWYDVALSAMSPLASVGRLGYNVLSGGYDPFNPPKQTKRTYSPEELEAYKTYSGYFNQPQTAQ